jgi:hypothetical protein
MHPAATPGRPLSGALGKEGTMHEDGGVDELQALDAVASENGAVLAFRMEDGAEDLEPVFMRVFSANAGEQNEVALFELTDRDGLSLGRYVISRRRLEMALVHAEDLGSDEPEPAVVPSDWER